MNRATRSVGRKCTVGQPFSFCDDVRCGPRAVRGTAVILNDAYEQKMKPRLTAPLVLVAIGANLPGADGRSAIVTCRAAAESLRALPGLRWIGLSRWYRTAPMPPSGQPDYINGVARLEGDVDPAWLLRQLQTIERRAGRVRGVVNAARRLDLDLVAVGDLVRDTPDPIVPHPRAHLRAFVLRPLADVAPGWIHPVLGKSVEDMMAGLPAQDVDLL